MTAIGATRCTLNFREPDTYVQFSVDTRNNIEKAVEGLLSLLDQMDPDPDLEANGDDELSVGAVENGGTWVPCHTGDADREEELEHDEESDPGEDNGDREPYLTFKGLRHTVATIPAEIGMDDRAIADMLDQKTLAMAQHYSTRANRTRKLAPVIRDFDAEVNRRRTKIVKPTKK